VLRKKVEALDQMVAFAGFMSRVWHKSAGQLHSLRDLAEKCVESTDVPRGSELHRDLSKLQVGVEQLKGLPIRMESLAGPVKTEPVGVLTVWRRVVDELAAKIHHLGVRIVADEEIPQVVADEDILEMVFYHLLDNALDACETVEDRRVALSSQMIADGKVELCVSDTGKGLTDDELHRAGTLMYSTKPQGTGSGLYFVEKRTADMGGEFKLRRREATLGVEALLILPMVKEK
jgi:signal transduction histidine kinase